MSDKLNDKNTPDHMAFSRKISEKVHRRLNARRNSIKGIWFGLGMMGLIGWSVTIPTILGVSFGIWIDKHYAGSHSWTLMLLIIGLVIGCLNAWHWVCKESKEIQKAQEDDNDK
jgi:ATP synthase protein I